MRVYKVLKQDESGYTSVSQHHPHIFEPGQVTASPEAPLFVFKSLGWARAWAQARFFTQVWIAEVDYAWEIPRIIHSMEPRLQDADSVRAWWANELELKTMPVPFDTLVVPALKLVKCIYNPAAGDRDSPVRASGSGRAIIEG